MFNSWRWPIIIGISSIVIAVLMQVPQFLHQMNPQSNGFLVQLNSDESYYKARVQEALSGRGEQSAEAYVGDPEIKGTQTAFIERLYGVLFGWTELNAAQVFQIMDSVVPVLIFLVLIWVFSLCGFTRLQSFIGASLFVLIELYNLNRPINMRASFLAMILAMAFFTSGLQSKKWMGVVGGALLGLLVGIYFWNFSFAWVWFGVYLIWEFIEAFKFKKQNQWKNILLFGVIGLVVALPFIWQIISVMQHPLSEYGVFRSGIHDSRTPESWGYTVAFSLMILGLGITIFKQYRFVAEYKPAAVTVFAAFIFMHQHLIHGKLLMFVSHSIFSLILAAICAVLLVWSLRSRWMVITFIGAALYLAAVGYDGRYVIGQWTVNENSFEQQNLYTLPSVLDGIERVRILSDPSSMAFVAGYSHHDVVYSIYLKNVLMTHEEIAERFCMTQIPVDFADRHLEKRIHLIWPDSNRVFADTIPSIREQELILVYKACEKIDKNPAEHLKKFDVDYILWDEKRQPDWDLKRFRVPLEKVVQGEGWSLWGISS
ncbi:MAG: hypothetical protein K9M03_04955 [Kiritimatiellales bacterium]|nr:hypothetical protein [Kiritimatiellales bacterium]